MQAVSGRYVGMVEHMILPLAVVFVHQTTLEGYVKVRLVALLVHIILLFIYTNNKLNIFI